MPANTDNDNHDLSYDNGIFNDSALNVKVTASPMCKVYYKPLVGMSQDSRNMTESLKSSSGLNPLSRNSSSGINSSSRLRKSHIAKDGKYVFPDGAMFSGYMVDGIPHGYGVTRYGT